MCVNLIELILTIRTMEFIAFAVDFVPFALEFVPFALEFVASAIEFNTFAVELGAFAFEFFITIVITRGIAFATEKYHLRH